MTWFDKMERKYGKYAIKNLMWYIIALYTLGFVLEVFAPGVYEAYFSLNAEKILHGQVWRIITFIIQPPSTSVFWIFFSLYMYYMIGTVLENIWGSFRFNVYFFMGVLLNVLAAILIYLIFHVNFSLSTYYINLALFMAFAMIAPDTRLLLFFIIPVKIKWLAYFDGIYIALTVICGYLCSFMPLNIFIGCLQLGLVSGGATLGQAYTYSYINATAALVSMLNFFVFWLMTQKSMTTKGQKAFRKAMKEADKIQKERRRKGWESYDGVDGTQRTAQDKRTGEQDGDRQARRGFIRPVMTAGHRCAICGRTEADGEDIEFRYCSKCEGNYEYCSEHLYTHVHVKGTETKE